MRDNTFGLLTAITIMFVLAVAAVPSFAVTSTFQKGAYEDLNPADGTNDTGTWLWSDGANWSAGVPGTTDDAHFQRHNWSNPVGVDTAGATLSVGSFTGSYNGDYFVFFDSTKLTPTYTAIPGNTSTILAKPFVDTALTPVGPATTVVEAANASQTITVSGKMDFGKQNVLYIFHPMDIGGDLNDNGSNYDFYGSVTVGGAINFNGRGDTDDTINFYSTLSAPTSTMKLNTDSVVYAHDTVTVGTINLVHGEAEYHAMAGDSSGGAGATINVNAGTLDFAVAQTTFPAAINTSAFSVLQGDFTGATYGGNTNLAEDTVLALTANAPVDTTTGVFDAKYWLAVLDKSNDAVTEAGDDGDSVYKGVAVGSWVSGDMNGTVQAPAGVPELSVAIAGGQTKFTANSEMLLTDTGTTQTANITVAAGSTMFMDGGAVNQNSAADAGLQVTTFNVTGQGGDGTTLYLNNNAVMAGQTYNLTNGVCYTNTNGQGNYGTVVLKSGSGFKCNGSQAFKNLATAGQYIFEDDTVIQLGSRLQDSLDQFGATVTTGLDDTGFFWLKGETIACFDNNRAPTINLDSSMQTIIAASNVSMSNNNAYRFGGGGLHLGDGKYLLLERNVDSTANGTVFIGTDLGSATVGIAAEPGSNNYIAAPFDANSATLVIGSTTAMTFVNTGTNSWNQRSSAIPTGTVRLTGGLANTNEIDIRSGTLNLAYAQDLSSTNVTINSDATLNTSQAVILSRVSGSGTLQNASNLTFNTVAPGTASAGALTADNLVFANGSTYEWEFAASDDTGTPGADWDLISAGTVDIAGALNFNVTELGSVTIGSTGFIVISTTGDITGANIDAGTGVLSGVTFGNGWTGTLTRVDNTDTTGTIDLVLTSLSSGGPSADANNDGVVDATDYIIWKQNYGQTTNSGATYGDFNGVDGTNLADLAILLGEINPAGVAAVTPEPATLALLAFGGLAMIRRKRRS